MNNLRTVASEFAKACWNHLPTRYKVLGGGAAVLLASSMPVTAIIVAIGSQCYGHRLETEELRNENQTLKQKVSEDGVMIERLQRKIKPEADDQANIQVLEELRHENQALKEKAAQDGVQIQRLQRKIRPKTDKKPKLQVTALPVPRFDENREVHQRLILARDEVGAMQTQVVRLQHEIQELNAEILELQSRGEALGAQNNQLEENLVSLENERNGLRSIVADEKQKNVSARKLYHNAIYQALQQNTSLETQLAEITWKYSELKSRFSSAVDKKAEEFDKLYLVVLSLNDQIRSLKGQLDSQSVAEVPPAQDLIAAVNEAEEDLRRSSPPQPAPQVSPFADEVEPDSPRPPTPPPMPTAIPNAPTPPPIAESAPDSRTPPPQNGLPPKPTGSRGALLDQIRTFNDAIQGVRLKKVKEKEKAAEPPPVIGLMSAEVAAVLARREGVAGPDGETSGAESDFK